MLAGISLQKIKISKFRFTIIFAAMCNGRQISNILAILS